MPERRLRPGPLVAWANYFHFHPGQRIHQPRLGSRLLCWCRSGQGRITIGNRSIELSTGMVVMSGWLSAITYESHRSAALSIGCVHLWPHWHGSGTEPTLAPPAAAPIGGPHGVIDREELTVLDARVARLEELPALDGLLHYIVERWSQAVPPLPQACMQGALLLDACQRWRDGASLRDVPEPVERALAFMRRSFRKGLPLEHIAHAASVQPTSLDRLFRRHLKATPLQVLREIRLEDARRQLRETDLAIGTIAEHVGFGDRRHFARVFKREVGVSASDYRRGRS